MLGGAQGGGHVPVRIQRARQPDAGVFRQALVQLQRPLLFCPRRPRLSVAGGAEDQSLVRGRAQPLGIRRGQGGGQGAPFQPHGDAALGGGQMVRRRRGHGQAQLVLNAVPAFVGDQPRPRLDLFGQGRQQHGPAHPVPVHRRIGDHDIVRQHAGEDAVSLAQNVAVPRLTGHGLTGRGIDDQDRPAQADAPQGAVVRFTDGLGLIETARASMASCAKAGEASPIIRAAREAAVVFMRMLFALIRDRFRSCGAHRSPAL
ncbi:hypothetical protein [Brevundimonas denitrificans]|uniref:hypothetical protein n=1 Tax=Brevundimonas denitrificans TaxID=1443434 RepID=UPI00223A91EE|nr:hypothetical protein [Brevundimonas denitrificans]